MESKFEFNKTCFSLWFYGKHEPNLYHVYYDTPFCTAQCTHIRYFPQALWRSLHRIAIQTTSENAARTNLIFRSGRRWWDHRLSFPFAWLFDTFCKRLRNTSWESDRISSPSAPSTGNCPIHTSSFCDSIPRHMSIRSEKKETGKEEGAMRGEEKS